jgi:hypothetical protein
VRCKAGGNCGARWHGDGAGDGDIVRWQVDEVAGVARSGQAVGGGARAL